MMLLALLLQTASVPPVPPPPRDSLDAALLLWADHPPAEPTRKWAIELAIYHAAAQALSAIDMSPSGNVRVTRRWLEKSDRLRPLIARQLPTDMTRIDREVAECVMDGVARTLTVAEIAEVRGYMATPAGRKFWGSTALGVDAYNECMKHALRLRATDQDYRGVGLKPPKPPKPLPQGTMIW